MHRFVLFIVLGLLRCVYSVSWGLVVYLTWLHVMSIQRKSYLVWSIKVIVFLSDLFDVFIHTAIRFLSHVVNLNINWNNQTTTLSWNTCTSQNLRCRLLHSVFAASSTTCNRALWSPPSVFTPFSLFFIFDSVGFSLRYGLDQRDSDSSGFHRFQFFCKQCFSLFWLFHRNSSSPTLKLFPKFFFNPTDFL